MKNLVMGGLWLALFGNLVYRFVILQKKIKKLTYSPQTVHHFVCKECAAQNDYPGDKVKENMKRSRNSVTINGRKTIYNKVYCAHCGRITSQQKIHDIEIHKRTVWPIGSYHINVKMDNDMRPFLKEFLLKGLLPTPFIWLLFMLAEKLL